MHVEIRDPDDKIILSKVYSSEGKFTFTSHMPGEHVICLYSNSTKWFSGSQLRVHLDIQVIIICSLNTQRSERSLLNVNNRFFNAFPHITLLKIANP